jgi:type IX secretion system PorP/SprF family membrane protein
MKYWVSILCLGSVLGLSAQNDPFFNHYMFNPSYYNPGWVGEVQQAFTAFHYRNQWTGYSTSFDGPGGAPSSQLVSFAMPMQGRLSGAGANLMFDSPGGAVTNLWFMASAAYSKEIKPGILSVGISPGFVATTLDYGKLRFEDPDDPFNTGAKESQLKPDMAAGMFFQSFEGYFVGIGVNHLLSPSFNFNQDFADEGLENRLRPTIAFHGGRHFELNRDLDVMPTFLLRSDMVTTTFDVGAIATYKARSWGGISYRRSEAATFFVGYSFMEENRLRVGYSFDYVVQNQQAKRPTSHEIFLRFDLPDLVLGGKKPVKTPRFTF